MPIRPGVVSEGSGLIGSPMPVPLVVSGGSIEATDAAGFGVRFGGRICGETIERGESRTTMLFVHF